MLKAFEITKFLNLSYYYSIHQDRVLSNIKFYGNCYTVVNFKTNDSTNDRFKGTPANEASKGCARIRL